MTYYMNIESTENVKVYNSSLKKYITLAVGEKYLCYIEKPTNKKDRENNNRELELLGFTDSFMGDAIVRYMDTGRRGRLNPCLLVPVNLINEKDVII